MDPARSEQPASDALTDRERDARIEQLLLTGLDHYFAADYDHAINLWTRVLFLDRGHDRARAYIERARSAQAERQREAEALMHQGLDALTSGDVERARQLVAEALARGASRDLALGVLDRIERLGVLPATSAPPPSVAPSWLKSRTPVVPSQPVPVPVRRRGWTGMALLTLAAVGASAVALGGLTVPDVSGWLLGDAAGRRAPVLQTLEADPLPLPSATELYLARSRSLFETGRLRDALRELDRVPIGDGARPVADRLRAEIQQALLASATVDPRPANEVP
jgi:tetratricopeptide (TPR) repeat protein